MKVKINKFNEEYIIFNMRTNSFILDNIDKKYKNKTVFKKFECFIEDIIKQDFYKLKFIDYKNSKHIINKQIRIKKDLFLKLLEYVKKNKIEINMLLNTY